ncbi:hypothetical protein KPHES18084_13460 [Corynebacterium ulcerans]|nr:hypothetical protein CULTSU28_14520 [Corynebacterium ulcerans]
MRGICNFAKGKLFGGKPAHLYFVDMAAILFIVDGCAR